MHGFARAAFVAALLLAVDQGKAQLHPRQDRESASAQLAAPGPASGAPTAAAHPLEASDIGAFFDGIIPLQLERSDVAGATVLVMQDDKVLLQKGYGFSDEKKHERVDAATTIFRLASISKLFTWTAVMQLAEQGKLNLDTDVNQYLDFRIQPAFGKPITLRNLMTHTGGFEETARDVIMTDARNRPTLREYLVENQPPRMYAPGTVPSYSNYGVGLGGYIVQRVSGEPFEQYVASHIFKPLGMNSSCFYEPMSSSVQGAPSEGYRSDTEKPTVGFEIFNPAPAGGLSSTAPDIGRFARALLHGGELDGQRILKPETIAEMWAPQFRTSDQMPPMGLGFYQSWRNNTRWIGHEGDLVAFHSALFVDPVTRTTLFVSYNSAGSSSKVRSELIEMFTDRYFPAEHKQTFITLPLVDQKAMEGTYVSTRRADSTRARLRSLFGQATIRVDHDGVLTVNSRKDLRGHMVKYRAIGKDLWEEIGGQRRLFGIRDASGRIVRVAFDFPGAQMERVGLLENGRLVLNLAGVSLAVLLLSLFVPIARAGQRALTPGMILPRRSSPAQSLAWLTRATALLWLVPFAAVIWLHVTEQDSPILPTDSWTKWFVLMNILVGVAMLLTVWTVVTASRLFQSGHVLNATKLKLAVVAASCLVMAWVAVHFHMIGTLRI